MPHNKAKTRFFSLYFSIKDLAKYNSHVMAVPTGLVAGNAFTLTPYLIHGYNVNLTMCCGLRVYNVYEKLYSVSCALIIPMMASMVGKYHYVFVEELFFQHVDYQSATQFKGNKASDSWHISYNLEFGRMRL